MARPKRNDIATRELHKAVTRLLRKRHITAPSAKKIELWAYAEHGIQISDVTIQKVLNGTADPTAVALELLFVLREYLDAGPGELGEHAEARLEPFDRLRRPAPFAPAGGENRGPEQVGRPFPWNDGRRSAEVVDLASRRPA